MEGVHVSRFGVIPKPHQPGKWRLITDLSSPKGASVNDGISSALCSLSYKSVDDAVCTVARLGLGAWLAKFDIASAYRLVSVHPQDRLLLGMAWKGGTYMDGALPFGLRSAPKLFMVLADTVLWIMGAHGIWEAIHYLDDYLLMAPPASGDCTEALRINLQIRERLGVPIAVQKVDGPTTVLTFLWIDSEIDSGAGVVRLPSEKLRRLQSCISTWTNRRSCTKCELLSLIGQLQHACCIVRPGRTLAHDQPIHSG